VPSPLHILKKESAEGKGLVLATPKGPLLVPKGKVLSFLKDPQNTFQLDGKELILDRYTQISFEYHLKETSPDNWEAELFCILPKKKIALKELAWFLAYPPLICHQGILYMNCPDILLQEGEMSPEDIEQDVEGVNLHLSPLAARPISCTPVLNLTDRTGGFANLSFEGKKDPEAERGWEKDLLETDFQKKIVGSSHYYCPLDKVYNSLSFLLELGWKILDVERKTLHRLAETHFELSDTLKLKGRLKFDEYERPIEEVVGTFNRKERFLNLAPGHVGLLPPLESVEWGDFLEEESRVVEGGLQFKPFQMGLFENIPFAKPIQKQLALTEDFKGELRPYQKTGVDFLQNLYQQGFSALLADEMGLGKTVQVLAFLASVPRHLPSLIVVPTSLLFNWESEIKRFLPDVKCSIYHGPSRKLDGNIILTTYGTVREDAHALAKTPFEVIVLDEAHLMKNAETLTAKSLFGLNGQFKLSMSGTPVENHLGELFSHFRFLLPGLLQETDTQKRIQKKISPFFLRRKKKEVALDLPPLTEQTVFIDMPTDQRALYDRFLQQHRSIVLEKLTADGIKKGRLEIFEVLLRLRQLAIHPSLFSGEASAPSGKMELLLEDIESIVEGKEKALVYSQFTSFLALIKKELDKRGIRYAYLDGATQDRKGAVEQFQNDPDVPLFLMSLKAGGVGLNLTEADYVLILDPWWNQAAEEQAIGRSHRIGRTKPVIAKRYISRETIEEKMLKIKKMKKELAEGLFEEEGSVLDPDILEELLS